MWLQGFIFNCSSGIGSRGLFLGFGYWFVDFRDT
jgi:hypothetical protein